MAHAEPPTSSPFVNPADVYNRARVSDNYLWQVANKLTGYRYYARADITEAMTVIRIVIARDGRLLDARIAQSSGFPVLDNGVLAGVRAGSPYAPLPPSIKGESAAFDLPLVSVNR
ncbi:TonB family C-terminal domain-containing protein [Enhydrobacter aerosaccus]|uniref:TonB family C-terminal domain-containing protein n=2 Tax=Enhydrobacter aerosaccus TaxID=225324 RepID=A0A1T4QEX6_9HYPH|nr:TonB family C-terminal domain-containing protein [Enhydrobacter aerosaccus]